MADNTTSDLGYKYVDPEDVTLKNLDTEKGGYYVSSVSGDTMKIRRRPRSRCVCEVSRPITSRSMWLLRIRAKARSATRVWLHHNGLERGPDGDDHGVADNLSDGDQSYAIRLMADNTTSDLGYKYVDPEDVTLKNLDTEKGGYYVSSVSGDTDEIRRRPRSRCVCEVSRPITSRSMWLLRIRAKARSATPVWLHHNGLERGPDGDDHGLRTIFPTATSPTRSV